MSRLILVPQYPAKLRYQEWWYSEFPKEYREHFDDVLVLGQGIKNTSVQADDGQFAPKDEALEFEMKQLQEYLQLDLRSDDILLLCDISFPGLFSNILFHKRPNKCFAICHATSKNKYDFFSSDRKAKWKIESGTARLFDKIFVASEYHQRKLEWKNTEVIPFSFPPMHRWAMLGGYIPTYDRQNHVVSVARKGIQKRNRSLEKEVERKLEIEIKTPSSTDWEDYYDFLANSRVLLITAREETFGYQIVDAFINGCIPVAPRNYSYPELLPDDCLYNENDVSSLVETVYKAMHGEIHFFETPAMEMSKRLYFFESTAETMKR